MSKLFFTASAIALIGGPAAALTAPELWADWQETMAGLGTELTATSEDYADGTLVLVDVTDSGDLSGSASRTSYGDVTLVEQADGSVRIDVPAVMEVVSETDVEGEAVGFTMRVESEDFLNVARDEGDVRVYDSTAGSLTYGFDELPMPEDEGDEFDGSFRLTMTDYASVTRIAPDDTYESTLDGSLSIVAEGSGETAFQLSYELAEIDGTITGTVPDFGPEPDMTDIASLGLFYDLDLSHGGSTLSFSGETETGPAQVDGTSTGGTVATSLTEEGLGYAVSSTGIAVTITPPGFPLPMNLSAAELGSSFDMPLAVTGEPAPFGMSVIVDELTVDESLWALFDPTGQLPRDAATLRLQLDGTATVIANILDPEEMAALGDGAPATPHSLDITELLVSAAGAELTGTGSLTFPDPATNPMPLGAATLGLTGGFALLDRLVALGFVPPAQSAIIRGMAGAVTESVGEDALRSELEFTEGGILANGLPLPF